MVAIGVSMASFSESDRFFHIGRSVLYLGLMFYSMTIVMDAGIKLEHDELLNLSLATLKIAQSSHFSSRRLLRL